jgi:hypothetical protein
MAKHTPLPWAILRIPHCSGFSIIPVNAKGKPREARSTEDICTFDGEHPVAEANARRILACVNALAAFSTEEIERAPIDEADGPRHGHPTVLHSRLAALRPSRDELLKAAEHLSACNYPRSPGYRCEKCTAARATIARAKAKG